MAPRSSTSPSGFTAIVQGPLVNKNLTASMGALKLFVDWDTRLTKGLSAIGQLIGEINADTIISGRTEGIGVTVGNVTDTGVMEAPGLVPATDTAQGAVVLPAGATGNVLGTASTEDATAFDAAGSAAAAQTAAESHADTAAATAQANAQAFSSNASNLSSGTVSVARFPGINATITTAALTIGGTTGSMTFQNGVLVAQTPAT